MGSDGRPLLLAAALLVAMFVVPPRASADPPFTANVKASDDGVPAASQFEPSIAFHGGTVYLAWRDDRAGVDDVRFSSSSDGGLTWAPSVQVTDAAAGGTLQLGRPAMAVDGAGTIHLAWEDHRTGDADVYFASSMDGGASWTTPNLRVNRNNGTTSQIYPSVAAWGTGNVAVAWADGRSAADWDVYVAVSADGGLTWPGGDVRVNSAAGNQTQPALVADAGGNLSVAWEDDRDGNFDIYFARSADGGAAWTTPNVRVDAAPGPSWARDVTLALGPSGSLHAAWNDERNAHNDIYTASSTDDGATWTSPDVLVNTDGSGFAQLRPTVAADAAGTVHAAWMDRRRGIQDIFYAKSFDGGLTWTDPNLRVDDDTGSAWQAFPSVAVGPPGNVFIAWGDQRNGDADIYVARLAPAPPFVEAPTVDGFAPGSAEIDHLIGNVPAFGFTYRDLDLDRLTAYNVTVLDGALAPLWTCNRTLSAPLPDGFPIFVNYNLWPCPTSGPALADGSDYAVDLTVQDATGRWSVPERVGFHLNEVLGPTAPVQPAPGAVVPCSRSHTLSWTAPPADVEGELPVSFSYQVASDPAFTAIVASGNTTFNVTDPFTTCPGGPYHWRVRATDGWEASTWVSWNFSTFTPPNAPPSALNPAVEGYGEGSPGILRIGPDRPTFLWNYTDAEGDPQVEARVTVGTANGSNDIWDSGNLTLSGSALVYGGGTALVDGAEYWYGVRVHDGKDWSPWASVRFRVNTPPGPPSPRSPADAAADVSPGSPALLWLAATDAEGDPLTYRVWISTTPAFASPSVSGPVSGLSVTVTAAASTTYYWRVQASDGLDVGPNSSTFRFTTYPDRGNVTVHVTSDGQDHSGAVVIVEEYIRMFPGGDWFNPVANATTGSDGRAVFPLGLRTYRVRVVTGTHLEEARWVNLTGASPNVAVEIGLVRAPPPGGFGLVPVVVALVLVLALVAVLLAWRRRRRGPPGRTSPLAGEAPSLPDAPT